MKRDINKKGVREENNSEQIRKAVFALKKFPEWELKQKLTEALYFQD